MRFKKDGTITPHLLTNIQWHGVRLRFEDRPRLVGASKPEEGIPKCIYNLMLPRMSTRDCSILNQLIANIFGEEPVETDLKLEATPDCDPRLSMMASHMIEAINSHLGVLLIGSLDSGNAVIQLCADALKAESVRITPSTLTKAELFGELAGDTTDWHDGVFTQAYRRASSVPNPFWIVMDGILDHSWIENLNSLMDDNRTLTLPSGERIPAGNNLRLIFNTPSLTHVTMATISRCGVIRLDDHVQSTSESVHQPAKRDEFASHLLSHPLILAGPSGSGKTFLLKKAIGDMKGVKLWTLTITPSTTVKDVLDRLFELCSTKRGIAGYTLEPACERLCICFKYLDLASDSVLELIRILLARRSFWHTFKRNGRLGNQEFRLAEDILLVATTHDTTALPKDLVKHFRVVQIESPSIQELESMCLQTLSDVVDTLVVNKIVKAFLEIQRVFGSGSMPINTHDLARWMMAIRNNPVMIATLAHCIFGLRSNSIRIGDAVSAIIRRAFGSHPNSTVPFADPSFLPTDDFLGIANAISTILTSPGHLIICGPRGCGRRTAVLAALRQHCIQSIIMNGHEFEHQMESALKQVQDGSRVCLVLDSLVTTECNACERLASLITSTLLPGNKTTIVDEQRMRDNLRIAFIIDEDTFDTLIPGHLINHFTLIRTGKWSKHSIEQSFRGLELEATARLSVADYSSTRQLFQVKDDFSRIHAEKSHERKQRLTHLTLGLNTLEATVRTASDLNAMLSLQNIELDERNREAGAKLDSIISRQQSIQGKQSNAEACRLGIENQQMVIHQEQQRVQSQLAEIEPVLKAAKDAVASINKLHLAELRSMSNPPEIIKQVLEAVCSSLGHTFDSWKGVQGIMRQEDFINSILNASTIHNIERVSKMDVSVEAANRASRACGPLLEWLLSQMKCANVSAQVQPLRDEITRLSAELEKSNNSLQVTNDQIAVLMDEVNALKQEYDLLTKKKHQIQERIQETRTLSERAKRVLDALDQERSRWTHSIEAMSIDDTDNDTFLALSILHDDLNFGIPPSASPSAVLSLIHPNWQDWIHLHGLPLQYTLQVARVFNTELPVIYDPEGIFARFIQSLHPSNVVPVDMNNEGWDAKVKQSIALSNKVLLCNFVLTSHFQSLVSSFNSSIYCITNTLDADCISFEVTPKVLESICTDLQLKYFRPDVHSVMREGEGRMHEGRCRIHALESELLQLISTCNDLISSEDIVNRIESIKTEIGSLSECIESISKQLNEYATIREHFSEASQVLVRHFEFLASLNSTSPLYSHSANQFLQVIEASLEADSFDRINHHIYDRFAPSLLSIDRSNLASALGIVPHRHRPSLPASGIVFILSDGTTDDLMASFEGFDTVIALGSPASVAQARIAMIESSTLLLENIHLTPELYNDMLQFKGRLLVANCDIHRPPPKHVLSKVHTMILEDERTFSQMLDSNKTLVSDPRIAFIHTWICYKERTGQFSKRHGFTLEDMRMANDGGDLEHVLSIYTDRIEPDSFGWREIRWLIGSAFSEEGFWEEPKVLETGSLRNHRIRSIRTGDASIDLNATEMAQNIIKMIDCVGIEPSNGDTFSAFIQREHEWAFNQLQSLRKSAFEMIRRALKPLQLCTIENVQRLLDILGYIPIDNNYDLTCIPHPVALFATLLLHHSSSFQLPLETLCPVFSVTPPINSHARISLFAQGFDGSGIVDSRDVLPITLHVEIAPLGTLQDSVELPLYADTSRSELICFLTFRIPLSSTRLYTNPVRPALFVTNSL